MRIRRVLYIAMAFAVAAGLAHAQTKGASGFEQLKALVGNWEGTLSKGGTAHVSYQLVSGGTALLERLQVGNEPEMVTMYTPDGTRVAMTHYCNAGNQPQMRTVPITGETKEFSFAFVRATNLASPDAGHMDHLLLTLQDKDHFTQAWTWKEKGKMTTAAFRYTRKD